MKLVITYLFTRVNSSETKVPGVVIGQEGGVIFNQTNKQRGR